MFARLQAEKKRRGYRDFVKELSPTDRFTFRSTQYRSCSIALGAPQVALQNLSAAARLLPVNFTILEDIKSAYEILKDDERSAQLQRVLEYLKGLGQGEGAANRVVYEVIFRRSAL